MLRRMRMVCAGGVAALAAVALAGCSGEVSIGEKQVSQDQVEQNARTQLTKAVGQQAPPIDCPDDLKAEVGAKMTCTMQLDGKPYDVLIDVTSVEGDDVKYDVKVADEPRASS
jgi:hypothetical protein